MPNGMPIPPYGIASGAERKLGTIIGDNETSDLVQTGTIPYLLKGLVAQIAYLHDTIQVSTTGENPSVPSDAHTLPEGLAWMVCTTTTVAPNTRQLTGPGMGFEMENSIKGGLSEEPAPQRRSWNA